MTRTRDLQILPYHCHWPIVFFRMSQRGWTPRTYLPVYHILPKAYLIWPFSLRAGHHFAVWPCLTSRKLFHADITHYANLLLHVSLAIITYLTYLIIHIHQLHFFRLNLPLGMTIPMWFTTWFKVLWLPSYQVSTSKNLIRWMFGQALRMRSVFPIT